MQTIGTKIALSLLLLSSVASRAQSVVQVINGGTGSNNVPAANGALGIPGPKVNVLGYGAKGDCATDNQAALIAAENAANATNPAGVLYFPLPPGGCYLTSTLPWYGLSMEGEPPVGVNPPNGTAGVIIEGMPGEDIFHAPDPTTVTTLAPRTSMSLRDIVFEFDDTVDVSSTVGAHRWPGRWVQDAGMTASSAVFTSPHSVISCGDIGQAIQVNGAGPGGANLVTTISSVVPCAANALGQIPTITLAAAASTTVAAGTGTAYISIVGLPVTQTVGNAALAFDCYDGNTADYTMAGVPLINQFEMTNVKFYGLSNASLNHSAGIFIQGYYAPARLTVTNGDLYGAFGAVFVPAQLDSYQTQGLQDYLTWNGGTWEGTYPFISYDGGDGIISGVQVYDSQYGPQIMNSGVYTGDNVTGWTINAPETEGATTPNYGWRLEGSGFHLTNTYLGGAAGGTVGPIWDAVDSTCANCGWLGTPTVNGSRNHIDFTGSLQTQQPIDNGIGNQITYRGFNPSGASASRSSNLTQTIFDQPVGARTADSFRNGNAGMYPSDSDLVFGPVDFKNFGVTDSAAEISADSTAFFGKAFAINNATPYILGFYSMEGVNYAGNGEAVIGTEVPLTKAQVIFGFKCAASTSITFTVYAIASYAVLGTDTPTCHTGWTTDAIPVDFTSYSGQGFGLGVTSSSNDAQIEFVAIRPYQHDYNGKQPVLSATPIGTTGSGVAVPTGPTTSSNNDVAGFTGTNGQLKDLGFAYTAYPAADIAVGSLASGMAATTQLIGDTSTDLSTDAFVHNVVNAAILTGTTGTITGTSLSATCDSGTASVTGAVVGSPVAVSSTTGADVGGAFYLRASVTSTGTVTVYVCGTGTPANLAYNVVVF